MNIKNSKIGLEQFMACKVQVWDFDGVVIESVGIKEEAFIETLRKCEGIPPDFADYVRHYHQREGGVSRTKKFQHFKKKFGLSLSVQELCRVFSEFTLARLKTATLVAGVETALSLDRYRVIGSAMPQDELDFLVAHFDLKDYFSFYFGGEGSKDSACHLAISYAIQNGISIGNIGFVGDASSDRDTAARNGLKFYGRRHEFNKRVNLGDDIFYDFTVLN